MKQEKFDSSLSPEAIAAIGRANLRAVLVIADFYETIADELAAGAAAVLAAAGITPDKRYVAGAFEIPAAMARLAGRYDIFIALGAVVRGETSHYDIVAGESARGLMDLAIHKNTLIGNGILTVDTIEQAMARASRQQGNKGGFAAMAALRLWLASQ